jgi:hypothetical protein
MMGEKVVKVNSSSKKFFLFKMHFHLPSASCIERNIWNQKVIAHRPSDLARINSLAAY